MPPDTRPALVACRVRVLARSITALHDGHAEAVHRVRVACRRLREVLPVAASGLPGLRKLTKQIGELRRILGPVREADVSLALVGDLAGTGRFDRATLDVAAAALARDRADAWSAARRALDALDIGDLLEELVAFSGALRVRSTRRPRTARTPDVWPAVLDLRLSRRAAEAAGAIERAGALYLPDRLHQVRLAAKKLRYACELAEEARGPIRGVRWRPQLETLQETLGRLHDLQVLIDYTHRLHDGPEPVSLTAWNERRVVQRVLEDSCRERHAAYLRHQRELLRLCTRLRTGAPHPTPRAERSRATG